MKTDLRDEPEILGFVLSQSGDLLEVMHRNAFAISDKKLLDRRWDAIERAITGATLVLHASFGGLSEGMLDEKADEKVHCGDTIEAFATGFSVRLVDTLDRMDDRRVSFSLPIEFDKETERPTRLLVVERGEAQDGKALSKTAQLLVEHQDWAHLAAQRMASRLALPRDLAGVIALAARLHDEGKRADNWQRAFNAPRDGVYGKTKGPINQQALSHYRHEFGSLPYAEKDESFTASPLDLKDLVLHLIAAHHGNARPVIDTRGCADGPSSVLRDRARDVALRFARLQKRYGPWGLAWLEALVRAADQQASRQLEAKANG